MEVLRGIEDEVFGPSLGKVVIDGLHLPGFGIEKGEAPFASGTNVEQVEQVWMVVDVIEIVFGGGDLAMIGTDEEECVVILLIFFEENFPKGMSDGFHFGN